MSDAPLIMTKDQQNALDKMFEFLLDPIEPVFLLEGYSGTGKSTLVKRFFEMLPKYIRTIKLIHPGFKELPMELTATTNKAADALRAITGLPVMTIHSFLGLRVQKNYDTGASTLIPKANAMIYDTLIIIDECSYVDAQLLDWIFKLTKNCKIIFMGDRAQLLAVRCQSPPVFAAGFKGAELSEVVRQAEGNQIIEVSTMFRHAVNTGVFGKFKPDGNVIKRVTGPEFKAAIEAEFSRPDWKYNDSKILAYRNETVIRYNHHIRSVVKGDPDLQVGDYAVVNSYINHQGVSFKTDQTVLITGKGPAQTIRGVRGHMYTLDNRASMFMPESMADKIEFIRESKKMDDWGAIRMAEEQWVDLRPEFSQTVNKSQGSTYDRVFLDLDDIARINNGNQLARAMYVAISRARHQVLIKGDFVKS